MSEDQQYLTVDKKQLEYMRVVNLWDVRRKSHIRDQKMLQEMEIELKKEQLRR